MFKILFLLLLSTCVSNYVFAQNCSDCVVLSECPAATNLQLTKVPDSDVVRDVLRKAVCGYSDGLAQVCCSMLSFTPDDGSDIDSHTNLRLLPDTCGVISDRRLLGGLEVGLYEYPWMVLISYMTIRGPTFKCVGTLINDRYVLTTAHCVDNNEQILGVRIGEIDVRTQTDCQGNYPNIICETNIQDIKVEKKIVHEQYTPLPSIGNDIGLLRLQKSVNFSHKNAGAICLPVTPSMREPYIERGDGTVAGWPHTDTSYISPSLLAVGVSIYSKLQCSDLYNRGAASGFDDTEKKICVDDSNKNSYVQTAGSPLMVEGTYLGKRRLIQRGIMSHGPRAGASDIPQVYTDVAPYMKWILDNIKE